MKSTFDRLAARQPQLFSAADIHIDKAQYEAMAEIVGAIETVLALPAFRAAVLARASSWPVSFGSSLVGIRSLTTFTRPPMAPEPYSSAAGPRRISICCATAPSAATA